MMIRVERNSISIAKGRLIWTSVSIVHTIKFVLLQMGNAAFVNTATNQLASTNLQCGCVLKRRIAGICRRGHIFLLVHAQDEVDKTGHLPTECFALLFTGMAMSTCCRGLSVSANAMQGMFM